MLWDYVLSLFARARSGHEKVKFQSINWGCMDFANPHTEEMEVTFQYSNLEYTLDADPEDFATPVPVFHFDQSEPFGLHRPPCRLLRCRRPCRLQHH
mgnify:CR=1 FL=1